jgi:hypothetical protein
MRESYISAEEPEFASLRLLNWAGKKASAGVDLLLAQVHAASPRDGKPVSSKRVFNIHASSVQVRTVA